MSARRTTRFSLLAAFAAIAFPSTALAHATLEHSAPAAGAVLARSPAAVRLVFDDVVQPAGGSEVVANGSGRSVLAGSPRLAGGGKVLVLPLRKRLPRGAYSVRWRALSDDGHFVSGVLAFAVGTGNATPRPVLSAAGGNPSAQDVVARWLLFTGLLLAGGAAAFRLVVLQPRERERTELHVAALVFAGSILFAVGAASFVRVAGLDTRFGAALTVGIAVALACAACATLTVARRRFAWAATALALVLVAVPSFAGHALDAGVPWPNVIVDLLHVSAAAVWVGGLASLVLVAPAVGRAARPSLLHRFSAVALASVLVISATGVVRAVYELRSVHQLWTTGYGRALIAKSILLVAVVALGWWNRRRIARNRDVGRGVLIELALVAGVVAAVAFLTQLRPGRDFARAAAPVLAASPPGRVTLPPAQPRGTLVLAHESGAYGVVLATAGARRTVTVLSPSGGGAAGLDVRVDGRAALPCGNGCYRSDGAPAGSAPVRVEVAGRTTAFRPPAKPHPAATLVRRATAAFERLRTVVYVERLASSPRNSIVTRWRVAAPNRLTYRIAGGAQAVVIGATRWDRGTPKAPWQRTQSAAIAVPQPTWGTETTNAFVIAANARTVTLAWVNPTIPAFFTVRFERATLQPIELRMTASAHFMHQRYLAINRPLSIRPPTR